jgi:hypothetical protein
MPGSDCRSRAWLLAAMGICVALTGLVGFCPACAIVGRQVEPKE